MKSLLTNLNIHIYSKEPCYFSMSAQKSGPTAPFYKGKKGLKIKKQNYKTSNVWVKSFWKKKVF